MYEVIFGQYEDAYSIGGFDTEDAAKVAAAEHCLDYIEQRRRMPDPFEIISPAISPERAEFQRELIARGGQI